MATSTDNIVVRMRLTGAREVVREARSADRAIGGVGTTAGRSGKSAATASGKMRTSFIGAAKSAAKFGAATIGIATAGAALRKVGEETIGFDAAMRNVNSIAQLSEDRFQALSNEVLNLAGPTAQAPETLAAGLYDLVSSGFNANQALTVLNSTARAATAGLTDAATSTKVVAAVLNAYHLPAGKAAFVSDVLFRTVQRGVVNFEDLASSIGLVLPTSFALGVGIKEVGAALSTLTLQGQSGETATTNLNQALTNMIKPSEGMKDAMKALGYETSASLIHAKGFQGAIEALIGTTDGSQESVGELFTNVRALRAVFGLTGKNAKAAAEDIAGFRDVSGATEKALREQRKSISYQWNKLKAEASALSIRVGFAFIKIVRDITQGTGKIGKEIHDLLPIFKFAFSLMAKIYSQFAKNFIEGLTGALQVVGGAIRVFSDLLHLRFAKAWQDAKAAAVGAMHLILGSVKLLLSPLQAVIDKLTDISDLANTVKSHIPFMHGVAEPHIVGPAFGAGVHAGDRDVGGTRVPPRPTPGVRPRLLPMPLSLIPATAGGPANDTAPFIIELDRRPIFEGMAKRARQQSARR